MENDLIAAQRTKYKAFVTKFDEPNLIPQTQMVEEEFTPGTCFLASTHMLRHACVHTHTRIYMLNTKNEIKKFKVKCKASNSITRYIPKRCGSKATGKLVPKCR